MANNHLKRDLTLFGLTMIAAGASIGSGIFKTPARIADLLHTPALIISVWVLGGISAIAGALTLAELGGMFPKAGGIYIYIREAYGRAAAFLYGWANLLIINTGGMAGIALVFATYLNILYPVNKLFAAACLIVFATVVNVLGVKVSEIFANIFGSLKILGIGFIVLLGLFFVAQNTGGQPDFSFSSGTQPDHLGDAFATALIGVLYSYGGWQHATYLSGEVKNPSKNIPLGLIFGAGIVTILYVTVNLAYLRLLPVEQLAHSEAVASDAVRTIFPEGGKWIAALIMSSTLGTMIIYAASVPRVYFAMANDGVFFKQFAQVHPTYRTPVFAIVAQSVWALVILFFMGSFDKIIGYEEFMDWGFLLVAASTVFVFRKTQKTMERPYRVFGYPLPPIVFCGIAGWFLFMILTGEHSWQSAVTGLVIMALGLPFYWYFKRQKN